MEYQVLARKWRPKTFADMIGQEHITRTLQNALVNQKTAHAYLFVGPRGIGKTSVARIFAKALNCEKAPVKNPCCECESCLSIADGSNIDIIEIDGASNNSVNDIRNLRDEVLYSPVKSRYKVYIIDEVHMLSNQAWNALLKTLEEPPAHVKFLFATTEVHKILPTVLSRCQRFDLRRIPENLIVQRLSEIAQQENVRVSEKAIRAVARAADGGMRDALSLMDQMIAFHLSDETGEISEEQILNTFGLTAPDKIHNLVKAILNNNQSQVILSINEQAVEGKNLESLYQDILKYLRGIEICMLIKDSDSILEVGSDIIEKYKLIGQETKLHIVQSLLESLSATGKYLHDAINKQIYIETLLLKAMRQASAKRIEDLLEKINFLRKNGKLSDLEVNIPDIDIKKKRHEPEQPEANAITKNKIEQSTPKQSEENKIERPVPRPPQGNNAVVENNTIIENKIEQSAPKPPEENNVLDENNSKIKDILKQAEVPEIKPQVTPASKVNIDFITGKPLSNSNNTTQAETQSKSKISSSEVQSPDDLTENNNSRPDNNSAFSIDNYLEPATNNYQTPPPPKSTDRSLPYDHDFEYDNESDYEKEHVQKTEIEKKELETNINSESVKVHVEKQQTSPEQTTSSIDNFKQNRYSHSHQKVTDSPKQLWHKLIMEMDKINQPQLKFYLQEAFPKDITATSITVSYDEEFGTVPADRVIQEKEILNKCLHRITGVSNFKLNLIREKGIATPLENEKTRDIDEVKKIVESNSFVKETIKTFNGRIVDFRG